MWYHRVYHTKKGISSIFLKKKKIVFVNFCRHNMLWFTLSDKTKNDAWSPFLRFIFTLSYPKERFIVILSASEGSVFRFFGKPQNDMGGSLRMT